MKVILSLVLILLVSCGSDKQIDKSFFKESKTKIAVLPEKIEAGKEIEIFFKPEKESDFEYFVSVVERSYKAPFKMIRAHLKENNGIYLAKHIIQADCGTLRIEICKEGRDKKLLDTVINIQHDGKESLVARVNEIYKSQSEEQIYSILQENERIYPKNKLSWGLTKKLLFKNMYEIPTKTEIDSLYKIIKKIENKDDYFDGLSVCAYTSFIAEDYTGTSKLLKEIKSNMSDNYVPSNHFIYNLSALVDESSELSPRTYLALRINEENEEVFRELFSFPQINSTLTFQRGTLKYFDSLCLVNNRQILGKYINACSEYLLKTDQPELLKNDNYGYAYANLSRICKWMGEFQKSINISEKGLQYCETSLPKNHWDKNQSVVNQFNLVGGMYAGIIDNLAQVYERKNDIELCIKYYNYTINNPAEYKYMNESRAWAANKLTYILIKLKRFEEAKESLFAAFKYKHSDTKKIYKDVQTALRENNQDTLIYDEFIGDLFDKVFKNAPSYIVKQDSVTYNLNDKNTGTTFILVLKDHCGPCMRVIPEVVESINEVKGKNDRILVITNDKKEDVQYALGKDVIVQKQDEAFLDLFDIEDFPSLIVTKKGKIVEKLNRLPRNSRSYQEYLNIAL